MLNYNEIKEKKYIVLNGEPFEVVSSQVSRKQANKPVNKTKVKSLLSGKVIEKVFHVSEKAEEADINTKTIKYLYNNRGQHWFCEENNPSKRFDLGAEIIGDRIKFVKENSLIDALLFTNKDEEKIIGIKIPIKVALEVTEAPPAVKGNTAQGATKQVTLETGALVFTPLFIDEGDIVRINTDTGEYTERISK